MNAPDVVPARRFESYGEGIPGLDPSDLTGWLIVVEGTDGVGRTTHVDHLRSVLEREGYAVAETGLTRSDLAAEGIRLAKEGNTLIWEYDVTSMMKMTPAQMKAGIRVRYKK